MLERKPLEGADMKDKRLDKLRAAARETLIKSELLNFRMPADRIRLIYEIAEKKQVNISTLLRDWINARIDMETGKPSENQRVQYLSDAVDDLSERLRILEEQAEYNPNRPKRKPRKKAQGT